MIKTFAALLLFQCLGESLSFVGNIPVPGPVIGMLLLLGALKLSKRLRETVEEPSIAFLKHLSLLFVPAGVGIVVYAETVEHDLFPIAVTILLGTVLTVCLTALPAKALYVFNRRSVAGVTPANTLSPGMTARDSNEAGEPGEPS